MHHGSVTVNVWLSIFSWSNLGWAQPQPHLAMSCFIPYQFLGFCSLSFSTNVEINQINQGWIETIDANVPSNPIFVCVIVLNVGIMQCEVTFRQKHPSPPYHHGPYIYDYGRKCNTLDNYNMDGLVRVCNWIYINQLPSLSNETSLSIPKWDRDRDQMFEFIPQILGRII